MIQSLVVIQAPLKLLQHRQDGSAEGRGKITFPGSSPSPQPFNFFLGVLLVNQGRTAQMKTFPQQTPFQRRNTTAPNSV